MARPLRLEFPGALYHVTSRGNERRPIFLGDADTDRGTFLDTLSQTVERFNWICHAYCLMTNHYHLVVETPDGNLSKGMRQLNGVYTQHVNRTHGRVGHLFQGRFKGILVEKESHLLELSRYVVLNPIRAGMVATPEDWRWGSYRATAGLEAPAPFLTTDWLLRSFGDARAAAEAAYQDFVSAGIDAHCPWDALKNQIFLGSEAFVARMQAMIDPDRPLRDIPRQQRRAAATPLAEFAARYPERDQAMAQAYRTGAYSLQAIADYFGVGRMTVSRAVKRGEAHTSSL
ncbi:MULTISPECIES: transposase [unclassified Thiocapsa]|uniref:REP-associated tyrosine transposase n=1 Tax=unclassified Thiocapsa TaxID=2641286 RepID=UPI0035B26F62